MEKDRNKRQAAQRVLWAGLVEPRYGRRGSLSVDDIVNAALIVGQRAGMDNLSMRAVAEELGVGLARLHTYVPNKSRLFEVMSDAIIGMLPLPHILSGDWREQTRTWALDEMAAFRVYPWLAEFDVYHTVGPKAVAWLDSAVRVFNATGLSPDEALTAVNAVSAYVRGHVPRVLTEDGSPTDSQPRGSQAIHSAEEFRNQYLFANKRYPALEALENYPSAMTVFETGLEWLLDGVAAEIATRRGRAS